MLREILNEVKLRPWEKIIFDSYLVFLSDYFKVKNVKPTIKNIRPSKKWIGNIDMNKMAKGKFIINIEEGMLDYRLSIIAHEFTHIKQFLKKELRSDDTTLLRKTDWIVPYKEYNAVKDYETHASFPWEKEANKYQSLLPKKFKQSKYWKELYGIDPNIDFLMDNT